MKKFDMLAHIFLYSALLVGALAIYLWRFNPEAEFRVVLSIVGFYLVWGFVFHSAKGDIKVLLLVEYLCISLIVLASSFLVFLS